MTWLEVNMFYDKQHEDKKKHDFNKSGVEQRSLRESHPFSMCGDEMI